jgi:hypothetical protein
VALIFREYPKLIVAKNTFVRVPVVVQYEATPMLEITRTERGFALRIPIYNSDGVKLTVVEGAELRPTKDGERVGVRICHPRGMTVCELNGKALFEINRTGTATLELSGELYTPDRSLIKWSPESISMFNPQSHRFQLTAIAKSGRVVADRQIGLLLRSDGSWDVGLSASPAA